MAFKTFAAAGALALSLILPISGGASPAQAGGGVWIGFGNGCWNGPFDNCGYRPYHRPYARQYGYYPRYDRYDRYRYDERKLTCGQARQDLRDRGYRGIVTRDCKGTQYAFRATKNGRLYVVRFDAINGRIIGRSRI